MNINYVDDFLHELSLIATSEASKQYIFISGNLPPISQSSFSLIHYENIIILLSVGFEMTVTIKSIN